MRTHQFIFFMCNLSKEKMPPFSFTLSHSHCVSLYFSDCTSQLKLSLLCYLLTLELTKMAETPYASALCFALAPTR